MWWYLTILIPWKELWCLCLLYFFILQIPDADKDEVLVALKGHAFLNKGQIDQALKVENLWPTEFCPYKCHFFFMINKNKQVIYSNYIWPMIWSSVTPDECVLYWKIDCYKFTKSRLPQVSSELVASNPNLAQGFALRGLVHSAEGQQQLAEQRSDLNLCACVVPMALHWVELQ